MLSSLGGGGTKETESLGKGSGKRQFSRGGRLGNREVPQEQISICDDGVRTCSCPSVSLWREYPQGEGVWLCCPPLGEVSP